MRNKRINYLIQSDVNRQNDVKYFHLSFFVQVASKEFFFVQWALCRNQKTNHILFTVEFYKNYVLFLFSTLSNKKNETIGINLFNKFLEMSTILPENWSKWQLNKQTTAKGNNPNLAKSAACFGYPPPRCALVD
jgi:hypothetical protein